MADETGGYDVLFVKQPPVETECPICLLVLRDPSQVECCGRVFCRSCVLKAKRDGNNSCPMCSAANPTVFSDQNLKRILAGYRIYCLHREKEGGREGCKWIGELGELKNHLNPPLGSLSNRQGCQFVIINCSLCGVLVKRSVMEHHQLEECMKREYSCKYCGLTSNYENIVNNHIEDCPARPSACNHCKSIFQWQDIQLHINNECLLAPMRCPFQPVGCQAEFVRLELTNHVTSNNTLHAQMLLDTCRYQTIDVTLFKNCLQELCIENSKLSVNNCELAAKQTIANDKIKKLENVQLILVFLVGVLGLLLFVAVQNISKLK